MVEGPAAIMPVILKIDDYDLTDFIDVACRFGENRFGYAVTPNIDHLIRYYDDANFRSAYADASFVLLDSRFLANILRVTRGIKLGVCTGSDLTQGLFAGPIRSEDLVVVIGSMQNQVQQLAAAYDLKDIRHFDPPMGFIHDPAAVEQCLQFIEQNSPFRFCLLAVGAPQQEYLAQQLKLRGKARGLVLCVGAAINFLTGLERRAPMWMRNAGFEWAYRLIQDPVRLAYRYLVRGPRIFGLMWKIKIEARRHSGEAA